MPAWIINYTHFEVWDEITYPFQNLNGAAVEVFGQEISSYIYKAFDYLSILVLKLIHVLLWN